MSGAERSEILKKWGRLARSGECYAALGSGFEADPSINPVGGGIGLRAASLSEQVATGEVI
ncbi:hypothetical protein GN244_ATG03904 [Phytophthora infestans]|uniref:Uncharacterized protein n=1 Tax=Phytophthora infestans TaxID=4787 RepID=A0A833SYV6_PHYIN|nr:hypothetical protein GN244_ATG03904 [Phytophthora infestans]KAF4150113.1 hypothetical protein GN958_ATG00739 [Phytophthora infestans]